MLNLLKLANQLEKLSKTIPLSDISIATSGLRKESFDYIKDIFQSNNNEYVFKPIELATYPDDRRITVLDGRHRLILSKKLNLDKIPAVLNVYDDDGYCSKHNVVIDLDSDIKFVDL